MRYDVLSNKVYCTIAASGGVPDYLFKEKVRALQHDLSRDDALAYIKSNLVAQTVVLDYQEFLTKILGEKEWTPGRAWKPTKKFGYLSKYDNPSDLIEIDKEQCERYPKNIRFDLDLRVKQPEKE